MFKPLRKNVFAVIIPALFSILIFCTRSMGQGNSNETITVPSFVDSYLDVFDQSANAIDQQLENKEIFKQQFNEYKQNEESQLPVILQDAADIIKKFAESTKEMLESCQDVYNDFASWTNDIWQNILKYPMLDRVTEIIKPITDAWTDYIQNGLPPVRVGDPTHNPLSKTKNFYQDMGTENPFGLGDLFEVDPYVEEVQDIVKEDSQEKTDSGVKTIDIVRKDKQKFVNKELTFHQIIINNQTVENYSKPKDFSIIHGLPDMMKKDGVNSGFVAFIQEELNYINLNLARAQQDNGLIFDSSNPQLAYPPGYDTDTFNINMTNILEELKEDVPPR